MNPLVAVTCDQRPLGPSHSGAGRERPGRPEVFVNAGVVQALRDVGLCPVLLPPGCQGWTRLMQSCVGVVITGGAFDIHPRHYGAAPAGRLHSVDEERTSLELPLARLCLSRDVPILGICGGMQALVVAAGGTLIQHLPDALPQALRHEQPTDPATPWHPVDLEEGALRVAFGASRVQVNSTHHQAAQRVGELRVTGRSPDGVIEAVEHPAARFAVGVQWHPELLGASGRAPFRALAAACSIRAASA